MGSEIGHLVGHARPVRRKVVPHGGSGMPLREHAARFLRRLYATPRSAEGIEAQADAGKRCFWLAADRFAPGEGVGSSFAVAAVGVGATVETVGRWACE